MHGSVSLEKIRRTAKILIDTSLEFGRYEEALGVLKFLSAVGSTENRPSILYSPSPALEWEKKEEDLLIIGYDHGLHGTQILRCKELIRKDDGLYAKNVHDVDIQVLNPSKILSVKVGK